MATQTDGQQQLVGRFNAINNGIFFIKDVDADNQELRVKLRIGGVLTERKVDTSAV